MAKSAATYAGDPRHHHDDLAKLRAENERLREMLGELQRHDRMGWGSWTRGMRSRVEALRPIPPPAPPP